jgi:hypothetical protein
MVPSQRIACKAPKAKLFMKGRDFLLALGAWIRQGNIRYRQRRVERHHLAAALQGHLVHLSGTSYLGVAPSMRAARFTPSPTAV